MEDGGQCRIWSGPNVALKTRQQRDEHKNTEYLFFAKNIQKFKINLDNTTDALEWFDRIKRGKFLKKINDFLIIIE